MLSSHPSSKFFKCTRNAWSYWDTKIAFLKENSCNLESSEEVLELLKTSCKLELRINIHKSFSSFNIKSYVQQSCKTHEINKAEYRTEHLANKESNILILQFCIITIFILVINQTRNYFRVTTE